MMLDDAHSVSDQHGKRHLLLRKRTPILANVMHAHEGS
jgi:hypothetical protein